MSEIVYTCSVIIENSEKNIQCTFELYEDYYRSYSENLNFEKVYLSGQKIQFKVGSKTSSFMKLFSKKRSYFQIFIDGKEGIEYFAEKEDIDKLDKYFRTIEKEELEYKDQVPDQNHDDELQNSMQIQQIFPNQTKQCQKVLELVLNNPYYILGIPRHADFAYANEAAEKLKKLARLNALKSYKTQYDLYAFEKPNRELSVIQNSLTKLEDKKYCLFWFSNGEGCARWNDATYRGIIMDGGKIVGTYDQFLASYIYAVVCNPDFSKIEDWKPVFDFIVYLKSNTDEINVLGDSDKLESNEKLVDIFNKNILMPIENMIENASISALVNLFDLVRTDEYKVIANLKRNVIKRITAWFSEKEETALKRMKGINEDQPGRQDANDVLEIARVYCDEVEKPFYLITGKLAGEPVRKTMIASSYKNVIWKAMLIMHNGKLEKKAIKYANKVYPYCDLDGKRRIRRTFGIDNISNSEIDATPDDMDILGDMLMNGDRNHSKDSEAAFEWYLKAAIGGNVYSQNSVAICYAEGNGVAKDEQQAFYWFNEAAKQNNAGAQSNLAKMYYNGRGTSVNKNMAVKFWNYAEKNGDKDARSLADRAILEIEKENESLFDVVKAVTSEQFEDMKLYADNSIYVDFAGIVFYEQYIGLKFWIRNLSSDTVSISARNVLLDNQLIIEDVPIVLAKFGESNYFKVPLDEKIGSDFGGIHTISFCITIMSANSDAVIEIPEIAIVYSTYREKFIIVTEKYISFDKFNGVELYNGENLRIGFAGVDESKQALKFWIFNYSSEDRHYWIGDLNINQVEAESISLLIDQDASNNCVFCDYNISKYSTKFKNIKEVKFYIEIDDKNNVALDRTQTITLECDMGKRMLSVKQEEE